MEIIFVFIRISVFILVIFFCILVFMNGIWMIRNFLIIVFSLYKSSNRYDDVVDVCIRDLWKFKFFYINKFMV